MADLLASYNALSPSSPRTDITKVLNAIMSGALLNRPCFHPTVDDSREALVVALLSDIASCKPGSTSGRLHHTDALLAISAIKALGRHPSGSSVLASASNLSILLTRPFAAVANTLLLIESARTTLTSDSVNGGEYAILLMEKSSSPDVIFIASRILFLATASSATADSLRLDSLTSALLNGTRMAREAVVDLLKFAFNILTHYPKLVDCERAVEIGSSDGSVRVMGEYWSDRLHGILPPLLRTFNSLSAGSPSPLAPPLNHVIHALLAIPYIKSLQAVWLPPTSPTSGPAGGNLASESPRETSRHHGAFDRAKSMLSAGRRSLSRSSSPAPSPTPPNHDTLLHAYGLLEVSLSHYFPGTVESDDASVRATAKAESESTLDELLAPLVMLLLKLVTGDAGARDRVREWLLPPNLDRTVVLESRADTLGRLLRLLTSVYHTRLNSMSGELLYAVCNHDAMQLISQVGYGNVAGFLFNKGVVTGPPTSGGASGSADPSGAQINPITGAIQEERPDIEMTEEEREHEAEKLFVLFDRLERSGAVPQDANPVRRAIQRSFAS
ncbi:guanine nucleotide exchange factor synembryn-domain-containing protein [Lactarius hatsudake]|nr:guanine nucleotide exchange factor synembryn-domain-containing protein [Lactarius hatsudake]